MKPSSFFGLGVMLAISGTVWAAGTPGGRERYSQLKKGPAGEHITLSYFPSCDSEDNPNVDCAPPEIDPASVTVKVEEVKYREEKDERLQCAPEQNWGVHVRFRMQITASDASGVKSVGFYVKQKVEEQEFLSRYWSNNTDDDYKPSAEVSFIPPVIDNENEPPQPRPERERDSKPRTIEMFKDVFSCVPKGRRLEFWVSDLCATDSRDNARCIPYAPNANGAANANDVNPPVRPVKEK